MTPLFHTSDLCLLVDEDEYIKIKKKGTKNFNTKWDSNWNSTPNVFCVLNIGMYEVSICLITWDFIRILNCY